MGSTPFFKPGNRGCAPGRLVAFGLIAILTWARGVQGTENEAPPCFQQELDAVTTNVPLYPWPYYTADKDLFGSAIAISGETLAVASPWAGEPFFRFEPAVYIYVRSAGTWMLQQKLITPIGWNNGWSQSSFGFSIALEGNTLVVGDPAQKAAWVFERTDGVWSIVSYLPGSAFVPGAEAFGHSVGLSGERIIVGDSSAHAYIDPTQPPWGQYFYPGSVSVFTRLNGAWTLEQEFSPGVPFNVLFFYPIAISGDTIAVFRLSRVHVYRRGDSGWSEVQQLDVNIDDIDPPLSGSHSISMNGNHLVVGTGKSVHVFQNVNGTWSLQARVSAGSDSYFDGLWYFGLSAAIYERSMIVSDLNSAHVYELAGDLWTERYELDLDRFFNGPLGGFSPAMVAIGADAFVAGNNFPPVFRPEFMLSGDLSYTAAPSARQVAYFSSQDVLPPFISPVTVSTTALWPPDHQMVDVMLSYETADNCGGATSELIVTSDEPETGTGAGDTAPDWEVVNDRQVRLRAERAGSGDGRVYTIKLTARDGAGNSAWRSVQVTVPHD